MEFLRLKNRTTHDPKQQRELLQRLWFDLYSRKQKNSLVSSSSFEHVFLSEFRKKTVLGLHNWIYMYEAEKRGDFNYHGYMKIMNLSDKGVVLSMRSKVKGSMKPINSVFIGTTPELELALYTICFELRANKSCKMSYGGETFNIRSIPLNYKGKKFIGTAYVQI